MLLFEMYFSIVVKWCISLRPHVKTKQRAQNSFSSLKNSTLGQVFVFYEKGSLEGGGTLLFEPPPPQLLHPFAPSWKKKESSSSSNAGIRPFKLFSISQPLIGFFFLSSERNFHNTHFFIFECNHENRISENCPSSIASFEPQAFLHFRAPRGFFPDFMNSRLGFNCRFLKFKPNQSVIAAAAITTAH